MPTARTHSIAVDGLDGHLVEVETDVAEGLSATVLVGLPDSALRETRDRVRAAILNSGQDWPKRKITIGLTPANLPKRGSAFDLAIAIALLAADGVIPLAALEGLVFLAELGLDGRLRPVPGVTQAVNAAVAAGMTTVVAPENRAEAKSRPGTRVVSAENLAQVVDWLRKNPPPASDPLFPPGSQGPSPSGGPSSPDFRDYPGSPEARFAAEVCAVGGHNLSIGGRRGTGKRMLAERLPGILPDLCKDHSFEASCMHTWPVMPWGLKQIIRPPFVHPPHTCSMAEMIGGGNLATPGAASLAHRGVLLLDNAPEFSRDVLDALRQPIETGQVTLMRADSRSWTYPARFQLVLTATPCPCGAPDDRSCECSPAVRRRYLNRLAGPLANQVEIKIRLEPASPAEIQERLRSAESSAVIAERVAAARERSARRLRGTPWWLNSEIPCPEMRRSYLPEAVALCEVERAVELGCVSTRGAGQLLRIAWTMADMAGRDRPGKDEVHSALQLFLGKKAP